MSDSPDRRLIDELTSRLVSKKPKRDEQARQRARAAVQEAARRQAEEQTAYPREIGRFSTLAPTLLRTQQSAAELARVESVITAGLFRQRFRTIVEEIPAWELAAGYGTTTKSFKDGSLQFEENYRFMLAADGRLLFGTSERKSRGFRVLRPKKYRVVSPDKPPYALARACDLEGVEEVRQRIGEIEAGTYRGPLVWL